MKSRLEGDDITDPDEILPCIPNHQFAETGEIKSEFEAALARENEAREKLKKKEEDKSKDLILKYQEEYELNRRQEIEDQELALMVRIISLFFMFLNSPVEKIPTYFDILADTYAHTLYRIEFTSPAKIPIFLRFQLKNM